MTNPKFNIGDLVYHRDDKERQIPGLILDYYIQSSPNKRSFCYIHWMKPLPWETIWTGHDNYLKGHYSTNLLTQMVDV